MIPHDRDDSLTREILRACFEVMREIGHGFQETLYQRALALELANAGLQVEREAKFPVFYKKDPIGTFIADFVVERSVIVELKAVDGPLFAGPCGPVSKLSPRQQTRRRFAD